MGRRRDGFLNGEPGPGHIPAGGGNRLMRRPPAWLGRILLLDSLRGNEGLPYWRERILRSLLAAGVFLATFAMIPVFFLALGHGDWPILLQDLLVYLAALALLLVPGLAYTVRALAFLLLMYALGLGIFFTTDFASGGGLVWLFSFAVLAGVLLGIRASLAALAINALTLLVVGWLIATGHIHTGHPWLSSTVRIVTTGANFLLLNAIVTLSGAFMVRSLEATLAQKGETAERLAGERSRLVDEVGRRYRAEKAMEESLAEKEMLLREVHHRVKNNMQVISSLLDIKKRAVKSPEVRTVLDELDTQVGSMAVVHELLYQADSVSRIRLSEYVPRLTRMICHSFGPRAAGIRLELALEPVELGIDQAIPCALALNELISNVCKHAYPDQRKGLLHISASLRGEMLEITVADDGVGMAAGDQAGTGGQGLALARGLVSRQLGGVMAVSSGPGVTVVLAFPL